MSSRVAFVTGASKGVGRGIAYGLAEDGWDVAINYHSDEAGAEETRSVVEHKGRRCFTVSGDVGNKNHVEAMFSAVVAELGGLDCLVNNAGRQTFAPLLELEEADWDKTIRTNLKGSFLCTQMAGRIMRDQKKGGSIINIGSGANKQPFLNLVDYCASKGGLDQLTRVSACELGQYGIRVNCVAPGAIEIERTREESDDYAGTWSPLTPMGRIGYPADIARMVVHLAGDGADFVTGQTIYVDGGLWTKTHWPYKTD
ncbi:MAG: 3-oxoacyl-ACP reductase FabG [Verrucomicrobiales bacterium]|jgi:NAD(P)-dependent dehydrogenase (short-subunit alcohol dehydrogenase family)|nr:3-oxoacyl-ACP reductase FabG [Verrucomicrobiales bacterium]